MLLTAFFFSDGHTEALTCLVVMDKQKLLGKIHRATSSDGNPAGF